MAERGTGGRLSRLLWGARARALALVASGVIITGAGIAYLQFRRLQQQRQQQDEAAAKESAESRPVAKAKQRDVFLPSEERGKGDTVSQASKGAAATVIVAAIDVATAGGGASQRDDDEASTTLPMLQDPATAVVNSSSGGGGANDDGCFATATGSLTIFSGGRGHDEACALSEYTAASQSSHQPMYLTSTGPNLDLLKMMKGDGVVGGFANVTFWETESGLEFALKTANDTSSGRFQQKREIEFLVHFKSSNPNATNIVGVAEARTVPYSMLLMLKEPKTLTGMLANAKGIDVVAVEKVLLGILSAIDTLDRAGYIQRDIKGDNMLVGKDGTGILTDFGMCIRKTDASRSEFLGDGTPEYCAPEISGKRSGSTLCTELFSWFVVFVESVMMRHPFDGEDLFDAKSDRLELLEETRTSLVDDANDLTEQLEGLLGEEDQEKQEEEKDDRDGSREEQRLQLENELAGVSLKLEDVRIQEWRLGVRSPRQWRPNAAAKVVLAKMGEPLSFFRRSTRRDPQRESMASGEAKADPSKLFEGEDWVDWLPGPSRADCKAGVKLAVNSVLGKGVLHPDPELRPQTAERASEVLKEAVAIYEDERRKEANLEKDQERVGGGVEDLGAGG